MGLIEYAKDWWRWWSWEIGQMTGSPRRGGAMARASAVVRVARAGVRIERPGSPDAAIHCDPGEAGEQARLLAGGPPRGRVSVDVLIEPDRYLPRPLSRLRLPRSRMLAMARLDYAAATPFKADESFLITPRYRQEAAESIYYIVRRDHIAPTLDSLRGAGVAIRALALVDAAGLVLPDPDCVARITRPSAPTLLARWIIRWSAATAMIGLLAIFLVLHWRYAGAVDVLDQRIAVAEREAAAVQRIIDERYQRVSRIAAARSAKSEAVPLVRVLEELARTLPDTTWLTELDFRDGTVTFSGISQSAPALIPALESSQLFRTPTFSQQVVRATDQPGERFTITMELEGANG